MTDEIINQTDEELEKQNNESRAQHRIKQLSDKVELTARERDEFKTLHEQDQKKIAELERENAFNSGFSDVLGNYPAAKDHKDLIKEKVMAGYSVEDAALAVLGKAGKLGTTPESTASDIAGGSAPTNLQSGQKSIQDMTQAERREALAKDLIWQ